MWQWEWCHLGWGVKQHTQDNVHSPSPHPNPNCHLGTHLLFTGPWLTLWKGNLVCKGTTPICGNTYYRGYSKQVPKVSALGPDAVSHLRYEKLECSDSKLTKQPPDHRALCDEPWRQRAGQTGEGPVWSSWLLHWSWTCLSQLTRPLSLEWGCLSQLITVLGMNPCVSADHGPRHEPGPGHEPVCPSWPWPWEWTRVCQLTIALGMGHSYTDKLNCSIG